MVFSSGWVVVIGMILLVLIVVELVQKRQAMATGVVRMAAILFVLSLGYIFIINKVQLDSMSSIIDGTKIYFNWLLSFFGKASDVTSYAIKQNWTANVTLGK